MSKANEKITIGLLTLPLYDNFGGMLQAISLYNYLSTQGYNVIFLDNEIIRPALRKYILSIFSFLPFGSFHRYKYKQRKRAFYRPFLLKNIKKISKPLGSKKAYKNLINKINFDFLIVGSDQVWRRDYGSDYFERYFFDFSINKKIKKISYAASFGGKESLINNDENIINLLSDFDYISTRENESVQELSKINIKSTSVLDPTLLSNSDFFEKLCLKKALDKEIISYTLDHDNIASQIINLAKKKLKKSKIKQIAINEMVTISEWLTYFKNSDLIITDSYHGMIFSIIFKKKFVIINNQDRGASRFMNLLDNLGLSNRLIYPQDCNDEKLSDLITDDIDYNKVDKKLLDLKNKSKIFLQTALNRHE